MPDLLGPGAAGALNAVTARPPFTPLNQGPSDPDTWVRDCTSPIAADGTQDKAAHMNMLIAQIRNLVRSGAITENSANDFMMMQAVRSQRGNWLTAGGSATAITLAPSPAFAARADLIGVPLRFMALSAATGATTLTVNSLSAVALTWPDGTAIASGDWGVGTELEVMDDGAAFRLLTPLSPTQVRNLSSRVGNTQIYQTAGTYTFTVPANVNSLEVELQAAGGGAGASGTGTSGGTAGNIGGGGGGGGYGYRRLTGLTPGQAIAVTLGAPGVGVASTSGTSAGASSFGSYLSCTGGSGGIWGENTRSVGGAGGTSIGADFGVPGGGGGFSGPNATPITASDVITGYGRGGAARHGLVNASATGVTGAGFGAGGGGASGGVGIQGGDGAPPLCIVRW